MRTAAAEVPTGLRSVQSANTIHSTTLAAHTMYMYIQHTGLTDLKQIHVHGPEATHDVMEAHCATALKYLKYHGEQTTYGDKNTRLKTRLAYTQT